MTSHRTRRGPMPGQATLDAFLDHARALPRPRLLNMRDYPRGIPDDAVYIGRGGRYGERWYGPSRWRNHYRVGAHGTRPEVIARWEREARMLLGDEPDWLAPLLGKRLVCHCAPLDCHGDAIVRLLKERYGDDA